LLLSPQQGYFVSSILNLAHSYTTFDITETIQSLI
jgi:hypothetical protein